MGEHTFTDVDGVEIFYQSWPHTDAKAVVVIAHGASEHSGRYDRFARALNDAGYAAYGIDHRGHGRTSTSTGVGRTGPGGGALMLDDIRCPCRSERLGHNPGHREVLDRGLSRRVRIEGLAREDHDRQEPTSGPHIQRDTRVDEGLEGIEALVLITASTAGRVDHGLAVRAQVKGRGQVLEVTADRDLVDLHLEEALEQQPLPHD